MLGLDARRFTQGFAISMVVAATLFGVPGTAAAVSPSVVISQVYGGGGNTGAPLTNDYVELFNRGVASIDLSGWSLQYTSATGTGNFGATTAQITPLTGILAAGQYLLVEEASNAAVGAPLPSPRLTDPTPIAMAAAAGKVALVNTTTPLGCNGGSTPCPPEALAQIVDLVGYGNANFFEGAGPAPTLSNTTAAFRLAGGCQDTDANATDFVASAPDPRTTDSPLNPCPTDFPPDVSATSPAPGATNVPVGGSIVITFTEPVTVTGSWYDIACSSSGAHAAAQSGGPLIFVLNPTVDFSMGETCTVTVAAALVTDVDTDDPPDAMTADRVISFATTTATPVAIHEIQNGAHLSALTGQPVLNVSGIVTAIRSNGFYFQDPNPDSDDATSEGLFVFTSSAPTVAVGDAVAVNGSVAEFRPGGATTANLTITEVVSPTTFFISSGNPLPAATVIGTGGRMPPGEVIEDDATGSVETSGVFDPATDGIDFYESLESMLVQIDNPVATGPRNSFGEIPVVGDNGANASVRTTRGGILLRATDANPERIFLDDVLAATPSANVGDRFSGPAIGVVDYSFGNFKLLVTSALTTLSGSLGREVTVAPGAGQLSVASFNLENLDPGDGSRINDLAMQIVTNLRSPDLIGVQEVQDNNGPTNNGVVDANQSLGALISAIQSAGGPTYSFRMINPVDNQDGGEPGGNIRVAFLFRTDRGLAFVDRPGGTATAATTVVSGAGGPELSFSPGRIAPTNPAFTASRKPLAGEFTHLGRHLFVVVNHLNSKGGDDPLFGRFQPPTLSSEAQRVQQAQIINDFVDQILGLDANADLVVLGDLNDFEYSTPLTTLKGGVLSDLVETLPQNERYSYVFEGNSQTLDHILVSAHLMNDLAGFDMVHMNAEFVAQATDHDPPVSRFCTDATAPTLSVSVSPSSLRPPNHIYRTVQATVTVSDAGDPSVAASLISVTSNEPDNAPGGADGNTINDIVIVDQDTFRLRAERSEVGTGRVYTITYRATDACGNTGIATATVTVAVS
jgi:predicted extracellular nuclease